MIPFSKKLPPDVVFVVISVADFVVVAVVVEVGVLVVVVVVVVVVGGFGLG